MNELWYYVHKGIKKGPLSRIELLKLINGVNIKGNAKVWREGFEEWVPLEDVAELRNNVPPPLLHDDWLDVPCPLRRFAARSLDTCIGSIISVLIAIWLNVDFAASGYPIPVTIFMFFMFLMVIVLFPFLINAIILAWTGTSLGRAIFGIRLRTAEGAKLTFFRAMERELWLLLVGLGLGIPLVNVIAMVMAYAELQHWGSTYWDDRLCTQVTCRKSGIRQSFYNILGIILFFFLIGIYNGLIANNSYSSLVRETKVSYNKGYRL